MSYKAKVDDVEKSGGQIVVRYSLVRINDTTQAERVVEQAGFPVAIPVDGTKAERLAQLKVDVLAGLQALVDTAKAEDVTLADAKQEILSLEAD